MKYFTKEFYTLQQLACSSRFIKKTIGAEQKNEEYFNKCYATKYKLFLRHEKMNDWYIDPVNELRKIEQFINEPDISEEERELRISYKNAYMEINKERIACAKTYKFDKDLCTRKFAEKHRQFIELFSQLPKEILNKIADIRVFALGHASGEVKNLLRPYCKKLQNTVKNIIDKAYIETELTEEKLTAPIYFNDFGLCNINSIEQKNGDIILQLEDINLLVKNGAIIEGQNKPIYAYSNKPNCAWSRILATELHFANDKFLLNFLISNLDELEREELWYLTITGTDIIEIKY